MIKRLLMNGKSVERLQELTNEHALPVDITIGRPEGRLFDVLLVYCERDETLIEWMIERSTETI